VLSWLEIASAESGTAERVLLGRPPAEDGTVSTASTAGAASTAEAAAPRWPTPAEGFLAALAKVGDVKVGWTDIEAGKTAEIVAVVADCLLAAGALPPGSALLRAPRPARGPAAHAPIVRTPAWQDALAARWARRAHRLGARGPGDGDDPDDAARGQQHAVLLTPLPLAHASAVVETISVSGPGAAPGTLIGVTLHGRPWVPGAAWPMIAPCFELHADDDQGNGYEGTLAGFGQASGLEGKGTFWLWPPVADDARSLTITVSTLWEGARVQVPLPPSAPQPATPPAPA
jgi:hypothetical protein